MAAEEPLLRASSAAALLILALASPLARGGEPAIGESASDAAFAERFRALTAALVRSEFDAAIPLAEEFAGDGTFSRKAAVLARAARFLAGASGPPAALGVAADSGALKLSLAPDLALAAMAVGARGSRPLVFGHPEPFTSRVTLSVDGEPFSPAPRAVLASGGGLVRGAITERGVELVVTLTGGAPPSWHPAAEQAAVRIEVAVANRSDRPRAIGARLLLDLTDGFDDAPLARIGEGAALSVATEWSGDAVPRRLTTGSRSVVLRGLGAPAPERALLLPLDVALARAFDCTLDPSLPLGPDSALALYAEPRVLAPGESLSLAIELAPDGDDLDAGSPLSSAIFSEPVAGKPDATRVLVALRANGRRGLESARDARATPSVGAGLNVIESAPDLGTAGSLGDLPPGLTIQRSLVVRPDRTRGGPIEVAFDLAAGTPGDRTSRRIAISLAAPGSVSLAGRILDVRGRAVPDAEVVLRRPGGDVAVVARGRSDGGGGYRFDGLAPGPYDVLARRSVYIERATKAAREDVGDVLREFVITSETIDDAGRHVLPTVFPGDGRDVVLARSLTRYSLLIVTEWDAPREYLELIGRGMRRAAEFLYAASDGQLTFGRVAIHDCGRDWNHADLWDWANNSVHPNASVAGIRHRYDPVSVPWNTAINFGRNWTGSTWEQHGVFSTVVHEFGHYGLGLYDEYLGAPEGLYRGLSYPEMCRCIMGYQYADSKICFDGNHRAYTNQGMFNRRSCWRQIEDDHEGDRGGFFAPVTTPSERGGVVPPPVENRVGEDVEIVIRDFSTGGEDARLEIVGPFGDRGRAPYGVPVFVESAIEGRTIYQGVTNGEGALTLMGVHPGDRISATYAGARAEMKLAERAPAYRLEFGVEPRDGALPPLVLLHPERAAGAFAGATIEIREPQPPSAAAEPRPLPVVASRTGPREVAVERLPGAPVVYLARAPADRFAAGRCGFEITMRDAVDGDVTVDVAAVIGEAAASAPLASFDGVVSVELDSSGLTSIASTSGPAWIEDGRPSIGRIHSIVVAGSPKRAFASVRLAAPQEEAGASLELRVLDAATGRFVAVAGVELLADGACRARLELPAILSWFER